MQMVFVLILSICFLLIAGLGLYTTFAKEIDEDYFGTLLGDTSGYLLWFGVIGKGLLWICKKVFPKKYYKGIFRGIIFSFSCLFTFLAAGIWFVDLSIVF
ncbi:hypothetical protein [Bacillus gaemokensis]|uniref:DNA-binding protein n=1 Tax=Bacillus gaemokensis TaxID=574375 RepID=A0A073KHE5_9BACI|nr:hypothetical protein [Bacillus gaemokensis]KEK25960.1 DNA-binding protein [Bacillus gaemokensis]KYG38773.1 DNA-binding protein [Bacillus gaemokensis]